MRFPLERQMGEVDEVVGSTGVLVREGKTGQM